MNRLPLLVLLVGPVLAWAGAQGRPSPSEAVRAAEQELRAAEEKDESAHEKAGCFCQSNVAEKEQVVENMQQQLSSLTHDIDETKAKISQLDLEVESHQEELGASTAALSTAEALRKKDEAKFSDEEQSHTQSIDQLKDALSSLTNHHSVGIALAAVQSVARRSAKSPLRKSELSFLQLRRRLRGEGSNSPAVITGTIEHMINTFSRDLRDMRGEETEAKQRHEALASAKAQEITAQKKHLLEKRQRLAKSKVTVSSKTQIKERSQKLLDANVRMLGALKRLCKRRDDGFSTRREAIQAQFVTLSSCQADLVGTQLLSVSSVSGDDASEELCSVAAELREKAWRDQAQIGCKQARAGKKQDAAEAVEELQADIREAQEEASREQDECTKEVTGAEMEASVAAKEEDAEASFVGSEQASAEDQIQFLTSQSDSADKAKADFEAVLQMEQEALQALRVATSRGEAQLKDAAMRVAGTPAAARINEAIEQSEKIIATASDAAGSDEEARQLPSLFEGVRLAAGKALIPLRLMKADTEETAIAIKEKGESRAHARKPKCNAAQLGAEVARLKDYRWKLGKVAEQLAWESLR